MVADDAAMGVNQVIRGADLVPSTPRQILLYRALGHAPPAFGHVPLAVDADGRRLAKRDGSLKLATLREAGVDPRLLVGSLIRSCGWSDRVIPSCAARLERRRRPRDPGPESLERDAGLDRISRPRIAAPEPLMDRPDARGWNERRRAVGP